MDRQLKERLEKLTHQQQEQRFQYLRQKQGLADPHPLDGGAAPEVTFEETEEYQALKEMLGFAARGDENGG